MSAPSDDPVGVDTNLIGDDDRWRFNAGEHERLHDVLGAQPLRAWSEPGRRFAVWAPGVADAWVVGDFTDWQTDEAHRLHPQGSSGIWAGVVTEAGVGDRYKFRFRTHDDRWLERSDPFAFCTELPPATASVVADLEHQWTDATWMAARGDLQRFDRPISIYEMHVGSWRHADAYRSLGWRELAEPLADHVLGMGFTHVELLPIMEHPFYGSWGYQTTGFFAPTARYGTPQDFMAFVDALHNRGVGVILDWVPSHFPADEWALAEFDGTHLFEHADPKMGWHPDWKSYIFNYGRHEVRSFLVSSAMSWIDRYHVDGIRVDAVASMLYRDYSRDDGEWIPNHLGGRENFEAVDFLRQLNATIGLHHPDVITVAEESTAWPGVTRPADLGGLGFHYKWDMGWMHDTLDYLSRDPVHRRYHHGDITFRNVYATSENYVLPLSHDEVVHGKGSILAKMPGDEWQQFANLKLLYADQWLQTGKKLLFMGSEFGQGPEWSHDHPVAWSQMDLASHRNVSSWLATLNRLYAEEPGLHVGDNESWGFEWVVLDDGDNSVLAWLRHGDASAHGRTPEADLAARSVLVVLNLTPVVQEGYRIGVPVGGPWEVLANSDDTVHGGTGRGPSGVIEAWGPGAHGRAQALTMELPPLAAVVLAARATPTA